MLDAHLHWVPPPPLGQHNVEIRCRELGRSRSERKDLHRRMIISTRPVVT